MACAHRLVLGTASLLLASSLSTAQEIETVAGRDFPSGAAATSVGISPFDTGVDATNNIYTISNTKIVKIDTSNRVWFISEVALDPPYGVTSMVVHPSGDLYVSVASRIKKIDPDTGLISLIAGNGGFGFSGDGGPAVSATLLAPGSMTFDPSGNLYLVDGSNRIRRVDAATGIITTVAGTGASGYSGDGGPALSATFAGPRGLAFHDNRLYIGDSRRVRMIDFATGLITRVAGDGSFFDAGDGGLAINAQLAGVKSVAVRADGTLDILTESRVRRVDPATSVIHTVAGSFSGYAGDGGPATSARFRSPSNIAFDADSNLLIADSFNNRLRRVATGSNTISTIAGNGSRYFNGDNQIAIAATLSFPLGVILDGVGNLYIADTNSRVRRVDAATKEISTIAGNGSNSFTGCARVDGPATDSCIEPQHFALSSTGELYVSDQFAIRKIDLSSGSISTVASGLQSAFGVALYADSILYYTDAHRVFRKQLPLGAPTLVAGGASNGYNGDSIPATSALLSSPWDLAVDQEGDLFIADQGNGRIRRVDATTGIITTVAGGGGLPGEGVLATNAHLLNPVSVAIASDGSLTIGEEGRNRVRRVDATGMIRTIAGTGTRGAAGDGGTAVNAQVSGVRGLTIALNGDVYLADTFNERIRRIFTALNTSPGAGVVVMPSTTLPGGGQTEVSLAFDNVVTGGNTTVESSAQGPPPPSGFKLTNPPVYYEIATTAVFEGSVRVCLVWTEGQINNEANVKLFHHENGSWVDITDPTSLDASANRVCGTASSLSPFTLFEVSYPFMGFFAPIDNLPVVNSVKAGGAVPVKFSLGSDLGLSIFVAGYPRVQAVICDSGDALDTVEETVTAGGSSLSYDPGTARYTYVWKTDKLWANSCRELQLKFSDGSVYAARFKFMK